MSSDDDSVVASLDFSEPVSGITAGDIRVDGGAVVAETIALSQMVFRPHLTSRLTTTVLLTLL